MGSSGGVVVVVVGNDLVESTGGKACEGTGGSVGFLGNGGVVYFVDVAADGNVVVGHGFWKVVFTVFWFVYLCECFFLVLFVFFSSCLWWNNFCVDFTAPETS